MPNGLDAKVNGSGTARKPGEAPAAGPSNGNGGAAGHAAAEPDAVLSGLALANLPFVEELYFQFLNDPASVDPSWRRYFQSLNGSGSGNGAGASALVPPAAFRRSIFAGAGAAVPSGAGIAGSRISVRLLSERVQRLVEAYRELGHLTANLDPLGLVRRKLPPIALEDFGLADEDLDLVFSSENVAGPDRTTLRDLVDLLRETYSRTIGVELAHLHDVELRSWLQSRMEATRNRLALTRADRLRILDQVIGAEVLRAVPAEQVPRLQALLAGGRGEPDPAARAADRARRALERRRDRDRHGAPRAAQRARQRAAEAGVRDLRGVPGQGRPERSGQRRRREVPPRLLDRSHLRPDRDRPGDAQGARVAGVQPEPPRVGEHGRAGARARQAGSRRRHQPHPLPAAADPRRRRVRRPGDRRRVAQHVGAGRLPRRRHGAHHRQQPGRLHDLAPRREVDDLRDRRRAHAADPDLPRQRRGSGGGVAGRRPGGRLPPALPPRRDHRAVVLPQARTQRGRRAVVHAAGHVPHHRGKPSIRMAYLAHDAANPAPGGAPAITVEETDAMAAAKRHALEAQLEIATKLRSRAASQHVRGRVGEHQGRRGQPGAGGADRGDAGRDPGGDARDLGAARGLHTCTPS